MLWEPGLTLEKDPDAVLDWRVDFSDWLQEGESIAAHSVVAEAGLTVDSSSADAESVTFWLSGGTVGGIYAVTVNVDTSMAPRSADRTVNFLIVQK